MLPAGASVAGWDSHPLEKRRLCTAHAELGYPEYESISWFGLVAPAGTPDDIVEKIAQDVLQAASQPEFQARFLTGVGLQFANQNPQEFAAFLEQDRVNYQARIAATGVKLEY